MGQAQYFEELGEQLSLRRDLVLIAAILGVDCDIHWWSVLSYHVLLEQGCVELFLPAFCIFSRFIENLSYAHCFELHVIPRQRASLVGEDEADLAQVLNDAWVLDCRICVSLMTVHLVVPVDIE